MNYDLLFVCFLTVSLEEVNCQLCQNPIIGTDFNNTKPLKMMKPSFYLNTAHPAQCSGVGTSWRYCYHGKMDGNQKRMYYATLAVYRQTSNDEREYTRVSDIFTVSRSASQMVSGFDCDTLTVPSFDIQVGDVIGACVFDPPEGNERQLDIVGEVKGHSLMEMEEDGCSLDEIPQTISNNDLSLRNSRLLHVYANIGGKSIAFKLQHCLFLELLIICYM